MSDNSRWALITGASSGIGQACAIRFAQANWNLILLGRDSERLSRVQAECQQYAVSVLPYRLDFAENHSISELFKTIRQHTSTLSALINCAGVMQPQGLLTTRLESIQLQMQVNAVTPICLIQQAVKLMLRQRKGAIVNLSSEVAHQGATGQSAYAASKGAVDSLTWALARELGGLGIRVNAVSPGVIETPLLDVLSDEERQQTVDKVDLKRLGQPEEVAELIHFLCSDSASYIHGQIIAVDGGLHL